jgi:hypothetical protein
MSAERGMELRFCSGFDGFDAGDSNSSTDYTDDADFPDFLLPEFSAAGVRRRLILRFWIRNPESVESA